MRIVIQLFAGARDAVGAPTVEVDVPAGGTVGDLEAACLRIAPRLQDWMGRSLWAVDGEYAARTTVIAAGADIALVPPVSGG
ncbi:MAG: MoaD/ThiS family protein [Pirellulales bacterium]